MERAPEGFFKLVEADPLFAAEGMDLERGEAALDGIEDLAREYEKVSGANSFMTRLWYVRHQLAGSALPIPFLRSFIQSERARRRFLSYPSRAVAAELLSAWSETQKKLLTSVRNFSYLQRTLHRLESSEPSPALFDKYGHQIMWRDVEAQLQLLEQNACVLGAEIEKRKAIFEKGLDYAAPEHSNVSPFSKDFIAAEIPEKYKKIHEMELAHALPFRHGTILEKYGPLAYTLPHFDATPTSHVFMTYIVRDDTTRIVSLKVMAVDEYRFRKTEAAADGWHLRSQALILGKGIPYWHQPVTNLYTMRDQQYWAEIATIVDIRRRPDLDVALVSAQRSSLLDLLLGACLEDHHIVLAHLKDNCKRGNYTLKLAHWWSLVRTHPSIYFMPYNQSVWRLPEQLSFLGTGTSVLKDNPYLPGDTVLPTLTPAQVDLVMRAGRIREEMREASLQEQVGSGHK